MLSGLPSIPSEIRLEIDCARRRSRVLETVAVPMYAMRGSGAPRHRRLYHRLAPIAAGSVDEALARRLCEEGPLQPT